MSWKHKSSLISEESAADGAGTVFKLSKEIYLDVHDILFEAKGFQNYAPFCSKIVCAYTFSCDKAVIGDLLITISDSFS